MRSTQTLFFFTSLFFIDVQGLTSYANDFVDPDFIVLGDFGKNTLASQQTVKAWARQSASDGPWSKYA